MRRSTIERLTRYYLVLSESGRTTTSEHFASEELASLLDIDPTQIRRDMARVGVKGRPNVGFQRADALARIASQLGFKQLRGAVIVGAGRLACALAEHPTFDAFGLAIVGLFDDDPERVGELVGGATVFPLRELERETRRLQVRLGILTPTSGLSPQAAAASLIQAGVIALWNFTPVTLRLPAHVIVRQEQLSVELAELATFLRRPTH